MKKLLLVFFAIVLLAGFAAAAVPIDLSWHMNNCFESNFPGTLKASCTWYATYFNEQVDAKIPFWLRQLFSYKANLVVSDNGSFGVETSKCHIVTIQKSALSSPNATITTNTATLNAIANSSNPIIKISQELKNNNIQVQTNNFEIKLIIWLLKR